MEIKDVAIWKPIEFSEAWERCSTSKLDVLLPSWVRRRQTLKEDSKAYNQFMERLKRQHAIETGVIEKLYDLSEGVTETFIKEGFVESYLQHGDTNIPPHQLMNYLNDNFSAIDFVFEFVKNGEEFSIRFIKTLHEIITAHQDFVDEYDQFRNHRKAPLLKGAFKENPNNPTRDSEGKRFIYCPPVYVASEMDNLVSIYQSLEEKKLHPLLISSWLHHAFVIIHPFQDGNGRVARMLASLVLIKHGLFPLTVKRGEKKRYIDGLELADNGMPQKLVDYFGEMQKKNIEGALNMRLEVDLEKTALSDVAELLSNKIKLEKNKTEELLANLKQIEENTATVISDIAKILKEINSELNPKFEGTVKFSFPVHLPVQNEYVDEKLLEYASAHSYVYHPVYLNANMFSGIDMGENRSYRFLVSVHNYGYDTNTLSIGTLLFSRLGLNEKFEIMPYYPSLPPFTISIEVDKTELAKGYQELQTYVRDAYTLALAQIASEINP